METVPINRLLVESDTYSSADVTGGTIGAITFVAWARNVPAGEATSATSKNGSPFLGSVTIGND